MDIYLVGGAVRDELLGYPFHERDWLVVGATPETLLTVAEAIELVGISAWTEFTRPSVRGNM